MINQINMQRSGMHQPLLCQDSLLTSMAQQHANDMAALDDLEHDLSCDTNAIPVQFCKSSSRLETFGQAAENIIALTGNDGSASSAMAKLNADSAQFSTMMNPDYLYVGVGMAMNLVSGKYYWAQVFSAGNYQGVSCTLTPSVTIIDAFNQTTTTVQPMDGLKLINYPKGITHHNDNNNQNLFCTLIPHAQGTSSVLPLGKLPYPTITLVPRNSSSIVAEKASGVVMAFQSALSKAGASIVGPSSIAMIPLQVIPTSISRSRSTSTSTSITSTLSSSSVSVNIASMLSTFSPTNSDQSSAFAMMSSMMADPSMSSIAAQMGQFMMMATPTQSKSSIASTATTSQ